MNNNTEILLKHTEKQKDHKKYYKQPNVKKCQKRRCKTTKSAVKSKAAKLFIFSNFVAIFHLSYVFYIICQANGASCGHSTSFVYLCAHLETSNVWQSVKKFPLEMRKFKSEENIFKA